MLYLRPRPTEDEFDDLTTDDCKTIITQQLEAYNLIKEQAHRIVRTFLAGAAIVIAFTGSELFDLLVNFEYQPKEIVIDGGNLTLSKDAWIDIWAHHLFVAEVTAIFGFWLLLEAFVIAIAILQSESPEPVAASSIPYSKSHTPIDKRRHHRHKKWAEENRVHLYKINYLLKSCYYQIGFGLVTLALGASLLIGPFMKDIYITGVLDIVYYSIGGVLIWSLVTKLFIYGIQDDNGRSLKGALSEWMAHSPSIASIGIFCYLYYPARTMLVPTMNIWLSNFLPGGWNILSLFYGLLSWDLITYFIVNFIL